MPQNAFQSISALIFSCILFFILGSAPFGINIFAPVLVSLIYNVPLTLVLWLAVVCGFVQDALLGSFRLGFVALSYLLSLFVLYQWRFSFFRDSLVTLPLMTALFSFLVASLQCIELFFFDVPSTFSFLWVLTDCFVMPLLDGAYAFIVFGALPLFFTRFSQVRA